MYLNNASLRGKNDDLKLDSWQIGELIKCLESPKYFIFTYVKIVNADVGLISVCHRPYTIEAIDEINANLRTILNYPRQSGKSIICDAYVVWMLLFQYHNNIALIDRKLSSAVDQLKRIKEIISRLPIWMQSPILTWNKTNIKLDSGCLRAVSALNLSTLKGSSFDAFYLNEFAYWDQANTEEFLKEYLPFYYNSKVIVNSTPNKFNDFWKLCNNRYKLSSEKFKVLTLNWNEIPGRNDTWKAKTINQIGINNFKKEYEGKFN